MRQYRWDSAGRVEQVVLRKSKESKAFKDLCIYSMKALDLGDTKGMKKEGHY